MQYLLAKNELKTAYQTSWIEDARAIFYQASSDQSISQQQQPKENTMLQVKTMTHRVGKTNPEMSTASSFGYGNMERD